MKLLIKPIGELENKKEDSFLKQNTLPQSPLYPKRFNIKKIYRFREYDIVGELKILCAKIPLP